MFGRFHAAIASLPVVGVGLIATLSVLAAFYTEIYALAVIPFLLLLVGQTLLNVRSIYFLLLASLPLSMEVMITDSLGTDLPSEPLMVGLMFITFLLLFSGQGKLPYSFVFNGISIVLAIQFCWMLVSVINSQNSLLSIKYALAKTWYIVVFYLLTALLMRKEKHLRVAFWCIFIPLTFTVVTTMMRHAFYNYSFESINWCVGPFFRNHVNYAAMITIMYPFIWVAEKWYPKGTKTRIFLDACKVLYPVAIFFSYTRTCMIALLAMIPFVIIIKQRLMKLVMISAVLVTIGAVVYLAYDNNYLDFAPDFESTVYNQDFGKHIASTVEGKDVSSMERVYRWVAAMKMFVDYPVFGFGPNTFYPAYFQYTVSSFETYVSDNPERSTVHNYYLLQLVEQGVPGLLIFLVLTIVIFFYIEEKYHEVNDAISKRVIMILGVSLMVVFLNLLLSDLIEADKVGTLYFLFLSLAVLYGEKLVSLEADSN